jgi:hypothetical protein
LHVLAFATCQVSAEAVLLLKMPTQPANDADKLHDPSLLPNVGAASANEQGNAEEKSAQVPVTSLKSLAADLNALAEPSNADDSAVQQADISSTICPTSVKSAAGEIKDPRTIAAHNVNSRPDAANTVTRRRGTRASSNDGNNSTMNSV